MVLPHPQKTLATVETHFALHFLWPSFAKVGCWHLAQPFVAALHLTHPNGPLVGGIAAMPGLAWWWCSLGA